MQRLKLAIGLLMILSGVGSFACGVFHALRGTWPFGFGEPVDLIVFGAGLAVGSFVWMDRGVRLRRRLLFRGIPEVELIPGDEMKRDSLADAARKAQAMSTGWTWRRALAVLLFPAAAIGGYLFLRKGFANYLPPVLAKAVAWLVIVMGVMCYALWGFRRGATAALREQLREKGIPICTTCGYSLHGLAGDRCPECGAYISDEPQRSMTIEKSESRERGPRDKT